MCQLPPSERRCLISQNDPQNDPTCWRTFSCQEIRHQLSSSKCTNSRKATDTDNRKHKSSLYAILFGQTIAFALTCANAASSTLENKHQIKVPTFLTGIVYFILSFHLVSLFWRHRIKEQNGGGYYELIDEVTSYDQEQPNGMQKISIEDAEPSPSNAATKIQPSHTFPFTTLPIHAAWYIYLILAILDVEANYLAMLSFQHTSLSSSMLLTSLSILTTVLLRQLVFQGATYGRKKMLGVFLCLLGGCLWVWEDGAASDLDSDSLSGGKQTEQHPEMQILYGDLLALSAACLYGLNDVLAEYFVKSNNDGGVEYLGMLGFFGSAFSFLIQVPLLEKASVQILLADVVGMNDDTAIDNGGSGISSERLMGALPVLLCFVLFLCFYYKSAMTFLSTYDSTILNLSLQSCPLWAVVLMMASQDNTDGQISTPPAMFFVSLALVVSGMFLYESHSGSENGSKDETDGGSNDAGARLSRDNIAEVN